MKQKLPPYLNLMLIATSLLLLSSCTHRYYYPKPLLPPLLTAAGQIKVNGIVNNNLINPITAISLAASPVNHLGVQVSLASASFKETEPQTGKILHDERQANPEISVGYYKKTSSKLLFEVYSGWGSYKYGDNSAAFIKQLKHDDYFLQPAIAVVDKHVELAFTLRYDLLHRRSAQVDTSLGSVNDDAYSFLRYGNYSFLEPGITLRFGGKKVMGQFQFSQNFALNDSYESIYGSFRKSGVIKFAFGVLLNTHEFFGKN